MKNDVKAVFVSEIILLRDETSVKRKPYFLSEA